jgi:hypothetical protein
MPQSWMYLLPSGQLVEGRQFQIAQYLVGGKYPLAERLIVASAIVALRSEDHSHRMSCGVAKLLLACHGVTSS